MGRFTWPPPIDVVNKYGLHAVAAVALPAVLATFASGTTPVSPKEKEWMDQELDKRRKKLTEMIDHVNSHLKELEEKDGNGQGNNASTRAADKDKKAKPDEKLKRKSDAGAKGTASGSDDEDKSDQGDAADLEEEDEEEEDQDELEDEEEEEELDPDDASDSEADNDSKTVQIHFRDMFGCWSDCHDMEPNNCDLGRGLVAAARLLRREMDEVTKKTATGEQQYRDGEELDGLLIDRQDLIAACRNTAFTAAEREQLEVADRSLYEAVRSAERVSGQIRNSAFLKAVRLMLKAKDSLPYVAASMALSAAESTLNALEILYRTQSLEVFRKKDWKWCEFRRVSRALIITRALAMAFTIMQRRFDMMGKMAMAHTLRTEMYKAMLRQDFEWYRLGQKNQRNINEIFNSVFSLPRSVDRFMSAPKQIFNICTSVAVQLAIIRQRSSSLLYAMLALYWIRYGTVKIATWVERFCVDRWFGKVISPNYQIFLEPIFPENLQTVRSFAAESKAMSYWNVFWKSIDRREAQADVLECTFGTLNEAINQTAMVAKHAWAGKLVREGELHVAEMENMINFAQNVSQEVHGTAMDLTAVRDSFGPLAKAWDLVSLQPKIGTEGGIVPDVKRATGEIVFHGVKFKYPTGSQILTDVSFSVPAGKVCGITGASGSGKSTVFKLIERFYDPQQGSITLDGMNIKTLNPTWLRKQISVVSQKPRFFNLPLRENLTYGCQVDPSQAEIEAACKASNIYDLVFKNKERFPSGLYTYVSGETLSGGELQRLAIARAILMDAPILLLDEATSALDSESQSLVTQALENLMRGRTVLSVAHRLEAIRDSDFILCMRKGSVVEQGSHDELVKKGGVYASLHKKQVELKTSKDGKDLKADSKDNGKADSKNDSKGESKGKVKPEQEGTKKGNDKSNSNVSSKPEAQTKAKSKTSEEGGTASSAIPQQQQQQQTVEAGVAESVTPAVGTTSTLPTETPEGSELLAKPSSASKESSSSEDVAKQRIVTGSSLSPRADGLPQGLALSPVSASPVSFATSPASITPLRAGAERLMSDADLDCDWAESPANSATPTTAISIRSSMMAELVSLQEDLDAAVSARPCDQLQLAGLVLGLKSWISRADRGSDPLGLTSHKWDRVLKAVKTQFMPTSKSSKSGGIGSEDLRLTRTHSERPSVKMTESPSRRLRTSSSALRRTRSME
eukprot:TRINITY_DN1398_c0_g2_i1.p1 TRINITY_DN1398_c0_g2~~TRINITY_DN1398_c0_g2_i1.p1  ORF type:complete len:1196 (+),score=269.36 TRINITY_DN1398_c0_g2_i1:104-3691(+)